VKQRGFTLLEVLVATLIMGIAVSGLMSALSTSMRSAARLTDYDRAALLGHQKMDELLLATKLPKMTPFEGAWGPEVAGDLPIGWRASVTPFEIPLGSAPGSFFLERIQLEIWWGLDERHHTFTLEGFRRAVATPADIEAAGVHQ
jgi:general secretion pathway protein I